MLCAKSACDLHATQHWQRQHWLLHAASILCRRVGPGRLKVQQCLECGMWLPATAVATTAGLTRASVTVVKHIACIQPQQTVAAGSSALRSARLWCWDICDSGVLTRNLQDLVVEVLLVWHASSGREHSLVLQCMPHTVCCCLILMSA